MEKYKIRHTNIANFIFDVKRDFKYKLNRGVGGGWNGANYGGGGSVVNMVVFAERP